MGYFSRHSASSTASRRLLVSRFGCVAQVTSLVGFVLGALGACSSSNDVEPAPKSVSVAQCPALIDDTNGKSCTAEGQVCSPSFACPSGNQIAKCTCAGGKFSCTDAVDIIASGAEPQCVSSAQPPPAACPSTAAAASGANCAQTWRTCTYAAQPCLTPDSTGRPRVDTCFCRAGEAGIKFYCETAACGDPGKPTPSATDAGRDATNMIGVGNGSGRSD
jgi:hypothetical protein